MRSDFYKSIDLVIRNTPVYKKSGLISTSFELSVPFNLYADMNKEGVTTEKHWDVDESEYLK